MQKHSTPIGVGTPRRFTISNPGCQLRPRSAEELDRVFGPVLSRRCAGLPRVPGGRTASLGWSAPTSLAGSSRPEDVPCVRPRPEHLRPNQPPRATLGIEAHQARLLSHDPSPTLVRVICGANGDAFLVY